MAWQLKFLSLTTTCSKAIVILIVSTIYFCIFLSGKRTLAPLIPKSEKNSVRVKWNPTPKGSTVGLGRSPRLILTEKIEFTTTKRTLATNTALLDNTVSLEINPHPFNFLILETEICKNVSSSMPLLLVMVHSDPRHHDFRTAIRETWGNPNASQYGLDAQVEMRIVFALGSTPKDPKTTEKVIEESQIYRDIIQEDFIDAYRNMTYKMVMWMKWATFYCPNAFQILKIDDDVFVNRFSVLKTVRHYLDEGIANERTLTCRVWNGISVVRITWAKWYVSPDEYKENVYPTYCPGAGIFFSGDLPKLFYQKSLETRFFWIDDVYATGFLREKIGNVTLMDIGSKYVLAKQDFEKIGNQMKNGLYFHLGSKSGPQYEYWNRLLEEYGLIAEPDNSTRVIDNTTVQV